MTDKSDTPEKMPSTWTSAAALTGAAIGSAALVGVLLYASRRKERMEKAAKTTPSIPPVPTSETDA